jgi:glycosyltransferase involved in cell wall biosynthesis
MRIAMLHPSLTWRGGAERQFLNLAVELQKVGHEIEIFTNAVNDKCYPELLKGLVVNVMQAPIVNALQSIETPNSDASLSQKKSATRRLSALFRSYTFDVPSMLLMGMKIPKGFDLINNHNFPTEWAAFFAKKRLSAPVVWMCNEPPFWFSDRVQRKGLGKINLPLFEGLDKVAVDYIDEIVVLSSIASRRVEKAYGRSSKIVRSGVDIDLFHKASGEEVRLKHGLENDFLLLQVGNIAADKRQSDSIVALYYLSQNYDNVKLILDGEGRRERLIALSRKLGVEDKVLFWHTCCDEELAKVYAACDVFVFPAQITWGLAVIEAMAASKPVLVSKKCGSSEIIQNGVNGIVVEDVNPKDMATHIEKLINSSELRRKIGENAYEYASKNLSWKNYAKNMDTVFQQALTNSRNGFFARS